MRKALRSDTIDVLTFYYVEQSQEWNELCGPRVRWRIAGLPAATVRSAFSA